MKTSRITCMAIAALLTFGSFARAQSPRHLDELAATVERQSRQVLYQTYSLHACGPAAQELKTKSFQMIRLAKHIHQIAHIDPHHGHGHFRPSARFDRQAHINHDVAELDRLMHEMQDLVVQMKTRTAVRRPVYGGRYGSGNVAVSFGRNFSLNINSRGPSGFHHGHGHGHGYRPHTVAALDRIEISLAKLSDSVHHLLDDTDVRCSRMR